MQLFRYFRTAISTILIICLFVFLVTILPWLFIAIGNFFAPNPLEPQITYGEFEFSLVYEMDGNQKKVSNILVCEYDGIAINEGDRKTRKWKENLKNDGDELFAFRDERRKTKDKIYSDICIENIDTYKVILNIPGAKWFLNEPDYKEVPDMPIIQIYDTVTEYFLADEQKNRILNEHNFKVIKWVCDEPVQNSFK